MRGRQGPGRPWEVVEGVSGSGCGPSCGRVATGPGGGRGRDGGAASLT
jgi:hypothetical protein